MVEHNKQIFIFDIDITASYNICNNHFTLIKTEKPELNKF